MPKLDSVNAPKYCMKEFRTNAIVLRIRFVVPTTAQQNTQIR